MDYEKDMRIDETSLDVEWLNQASLFMKYARYSAEARRKVDEEKQALDIIKAGIDKQMRETPEKFGIEKITEGAITAAILTVRQYQTAYQKFLDAKYEADMASSAVQAMNQRKDALENLVRLAGQSYFAGPSIPRDLSWEREQKQKRSDVGVASKLQRTK
jgi:hypothetical protein